MLIDTHAHLDFSQFDIDRDEVIRRSSTEDIIIIHSGLGVLGIKKAVELTRKYNNIYATLGLHPASCKLDFCKHKHLNNNSYVNWFISSIWKWRKIGSICFQNNFFERKFRNHFLTIRGFHKSGCYRD